MQDKRQIVIKDVAKKAGVSPSTVSRVLNEKSTVGEEYIIKVKKAIEELNYSPNLLARSLRKGKTGIIGVIVSNINNQFFSMVIKGIEDILKQKEYTMILGNSDHNKKDESNLLNIFLNKKIDGLIITDTGEYNEYLEEYIKNDIPVVLLDRFYEDKNKFSNVIVNDFLGLETLIKKLYTEGHKSFVLLNGPKNSYSSKLRNEAFLKSMEELKIKNYEVLFGDFTPESGYEMINKLNKIPDAVICGSDRIAYGALGALNKKNIKIPDDVSITGYDDLSLSKYMTPPLTTVKKPQYEMGVSAAKILVDLIYSEERINKIVEFSSELILRESTKTKKSIS